MQALSAPIQSAIYKIGTGIQHLDSVITVSTEEIQTSYYESLTYYVHAKVAYLQKTVASIKLFCLDGK